MGDNSKKAPDLQSDQQWMRLALAIAQSGIGRTWPNPSVGAVIIKNGQLLAACRTADTGRPHAETIAIDEARASGHDVAGATLYVTLEPCAHHGQTPPCAAGICEAGIKRVVIGCLDPDKKVAGQGAEILQAAGIETSLGICASEVEDQLAAYFYQRRTGKSWFSLKIAASLDGRIALENGQSKWITSPESRRFGHGLRRRHDAILIGAGTFLADKPRLTVRLGGDYDHNHPLPIILKGQRDLPPKDLAEFASHHKTVLVVETSLSAQGFDEHSLPDLRAQNGIITLSLPAQDYWLDNGHVTDMEKLAKLFAKMGLTKILVEGGGQTHGALLRQGLGEALYMFLAPKLIGADGRPAIGALGVSNLAELSQFTLAHQQQIGPDILLHYKKS